MRGASELSEIGQYKLCKFFYFAPLRCSNMTEILSLKIGICVEWLLWGPFYELEKMNYIFFRLYFSWCLSCFFPSYMLFPERSVKRMLSVLQREGLRNWWQHFPYAQSYILPSTVHIGNNGPNTHTLVIPKVLSVCVWRGMEIEMETQKSIFSAAQVGE